MKRRDQLQPPTPRVVLRWTVVEDPARRRQLLELLADLMDKPDAPEEGRSR